MPTTDGLRAAGVKYFIDSPIAFAVCSLRSGEPFKMPSRNIGRMGDRP